MRRRSLFCLLLLATVMLGGAVPFPAGPIKQEMEIFPVSDAVNDQRGFAIAMDGEWLAVGARLEDVDGRENAGAVHLFQLEAGIWREKATLISSAPQEEGQFGFALALRGDSLAVSALGEEDVYLFQKENGEWSPTPIAKHEAPEQGMQFGRSISVDGAWLAVGTDISVHDTSGAVYLYSGATSIRLSKGTLGDRFGHSVALRGGLLAVGAPGEEQAKGGVHLFALVDGDWTPVSLPAKPVLAEGDQFGSAVAVDGQDMVVGAPSAGSDNSGATWVLGLGGGTWSLLPGNGKPGEQLGHAVAIDGDRIAIGAPFGGESLFGSVHVFDRTAGVWSASQPNPFEAESADPYDLSGISVALSGKWVTFGTALGAHGGAGSASVFHCEAAPTCQSKGEIAVLGESADEDFGISVAADGDLFAVGARRKDKTDGSVTIFRRAAKGWRQEMRLTLPENHPDFGTAIAIHKDADKGDLLVVGEPRGDSSAPGGAVYLYRSKGRSWEFEKKLSPPTSIQDDRFGQSVATDGTTVVVGAHRDKQGLLFGAAYTFELQGSKWSEGTALQAPLKKPDRFGFAVAVEGHIIAVGAPWARNHVGKVHIFERRTAWTWRVDLASGVLGEFGSTVSIDQGVLAVGATHGAYVFGSSGGIWLARKQIVSNPIGFGKRRQGLAVSLRGSDLVVGVPATGDGSGSLDHVLLFGRSGNNWNFSALEYPIVPSILDTFGDGVALGGDFFVVTSPGDRVTVFELRREEPSEVSQ